MAYDFDFDAVDFTNLNLDDQRFRISTSGPSSALVDSIKCVGVITPPVLLKENQSYIIVSGFKRILACKLLNLNNVIAQILSAGASLEQCIHIAIIENILSKKLNVVEQGRVIQLLGELYSDIRELCAEANRLGFPVNLDLANKLQAVSQLGPVMQNALIRGQIALSMALKLKEMGDDATADNLTLLFGELGLGLNRQREILEWLVGISSREGLSINELINNHTLRGILDHTDMDRSQKSQLLRTYLKKRRYPEITKAEAQYHDAIKALNLKKGIQLIAPPHFEGQIYSLRIDFRSHKELNLKYKSLEGAINSFLFKSLWDSSKLV